MTLLSSGELALQDAGTNPTTTVIPERHSTSFTTGLDGLLQVQQIREVDDGVFTPITVWQGDAYGFNSNMFSTSYVHNVPNLITAGGIGNRRYQSVSNFGSLGDISYSDDNGTSRFIQGVMWGLPDASPNQDKIFILGFSGTSVPNSDATFSKIEIINGGTTVTFNRTDLSYDSNENGDTFFYFVGTSGTTHNKIVSLGTPSSGTSLTLKVYGASTTTTVNNGIAEEFGGADSSNVTFSDYYRTPGGTLHNTVGIPTSGEIKFSDFLGKTKVDIQSAIMSATITNGTDSGQYHASNGFSSTIGSASGTNLSGTVLGQTGVFMSMIMNTNGVLYLYFNKSGFSGTFSNTGWTTLNVYLGQSNNSGSADLTLARTAFTFTSSSGNAYYTYNGSSPSIGSPTSTASGAIFGSSGGTHFIEIV